MPSTGLIAFDDFSRRLDAVQGRIARACAAAGRDPAGVELLAVTKTHPAGAADYAARRGLRAVGENRVQEAAAKRPLVAAPVAWELIGHLQSNKARLAAATFDRIQSVDGARLAGLLGQAAAELGKVLPVLLQVNAGRDPAKSGVQPEEAAAAAAAILGTAGLRLDGLMTIAPLSPDPDTARRTFAALRGLRDRLAPTCGVPLAVLSMGMTGDLEAAVAEGSTLVRVGTALFGER